MDSNAAGLAAARSSVAYAAGVAIAAALAALFTYLFCRRAGLSRIGAAAAGWTFARAGYFSSRVMAGHLPLLEAYPALPLLLWLVDRALAPERTRRSSILRRWLSVVRAWWRRGIRRFRLMRWRRLYFSAGVAKGAQRARAAARWFWASGWRWLIWWPMLTLIGRSTRILHLAAPDNDVAMPYSRLLALIVPGIQGWAGSGGTGGPASVQRFPNNSYFWDTASYIGILPLVAIAALVAWVYRKETDAAGEVAISRFSGSGGAHLFVAAGRSAAAFAAGHISAQPGANALYFDVLRGGGAGCGMMRHAGQVARKALLSNATWRAWRMHFADLCVRSLVY